MANKANFLDEIIFGAKDFASLSYRFLLQNITIIVASVLTLLAWIYFIFLGYSEFIEFDWRDNLWLAILPFALYMVISLVTAVFSFKTTSKTWQSWAIVNIFLIVSLLYYFRVYGGPLNFLNFSASTTLVFVLLTFLIFLLNLGVFTVKKIHPVLIKFLAFFYIFVAFSLVDVLSVEKGSYLDDFNYSWLETAFLYKFLIIFLLFSAFFALTSLFNLKFTNFKNSLIVFLLYFVFIFQLFFFVYIFSFGFYDGLGYWHKSLMMFVLWDYLHTPFITAIKDKSDYRFKQRLVVHSFYHLILFFFVLYSPTIFSWL